MWKYVRFLYLYLLFRLKNPSKPKECFCQFGRVGWTGKSFLQCVFLGYSTQLLSETMSLVSHSWRVLFVALLSLSRINCQLWFAFRKLSFYVLGKMFYISSLFKILRKHKTSWTKYYKNWQMEIAKCLSKDFIPQHVFQKNIPAICFVILK